MDKIEQLVTKWENEHIHLCKFVKRRLAEVRGLSRGETDLITAVTDTLKGCINELKTVYRRCGTPCAHEADLHDCTICEPRVAFECSPIQDVVITEFKEMFSLLVANYDVNGCSMSLAAAYGLQQLAETLVNTGVETWVDVYSWTQEIARLMKSSSGSIKDAIRE